MEIGAVSAPVASADNIRPYGQASEKFFIPKGSGPSPHSSTSPTNRENSRSSDQRRSTAAPRQLFLRSISTACLCGSPLSVGCNLLLPILPKVPARCPGDRGSAPRTLTSGLEAPPVLRRHLPPMVLHDVAEKAAGGRGRESSLRHGRPIRGELPTSPLLGGSDLAKHLLHLFDGHGAGTPIDLARGGGWEGRIAVVESPKDFIGAVAGDEAVAGVKALASLADPHNRTLSLVLPHPAKHAANVSSRFYSGRTSAIVAVSAMDGACCPRRINRGRPLLSVLISSEAAPLDGVDYPPSAFDIRRPWFWTRSRKRLPAVEAVPSPGRLSSDTQGARHNRGINDLLTKFVNISLCAENGREAASSSSESNSHALLL